VCVNSTELTLSSARFHHFLLFPSHHSSHVRFLPVSFSLYLHRPFFFILLYIIND